MIWLVIILVVILLGEFFYIFQLRKAVKTIRKEEISKTEERRSSFISIISHQLRTPLSIIKGYLEGLLTGDQGELKAGQKEYLTDALKVNKETIDLVNDYLAAVRLDSEAMKVNPKPLDLTNLVEEEVKKLHSLAMAANCDLEFIKPDQDLPKVLADPIKIRQVIENILTNAIKYTAGHGQAIIKLTKEDNNIIFSCQDKGLGIPQDQQAEVFTKFFRAKNVLDKDTQGSGLGLYVAKIIIEALGGKTWIESKEGQGTKVSFSLPIIS